MIETKSRSELETMDRANRVVRTILAEVAAMVRPGVSTADLAAHAEARLVDMGAKPAFKGYPHPDGGPEFPSVICTSINDEIVHGIPDPSRVLKEGDILSLDFGASLEGLYGDAAVTVPVGRVDATAQRLMEVTRDALMRGIDKIQPGNRISDISAAVQDRAESEGFAVVRSFVGHGIGRQLHEDPPVPNFVDRGPNPRLTPGMVLAIEPMIAAGNSDVDVDEDRWTARTRDRSLAAHFELSVAVMSDGPWVLGESA